MTTMVVRHLTTMTLMLALSMAGGVPVGSHPLLAEDIVIEPQPQPPTAATPPDASRFRLPRPARVTDALSGARLCDSCTDFVDPLLTKSTRTYVLDWHCVKAAGGPEVGAPP